MKCLDKPTLKVAILDLYEGVPNQGMRCIREILEQFGEANGLKLTWDEFDVRQNIALPDMSYDAYISSGGPGSPLESEGMEWEIAYFKWIEEVLQWNGNILNTQKKHVFYICHSFQMASRFFNLANVTNRKSTSFGVFPIHLTEEGENELIFEGLNDPFYVVDSRDFQVISPDAERMKEIGATVLGIEKERPHVPLERAIMGIRFNEYMVGTQFHPEADAIGMSIHLQKPDKKKEVIAAHGEDKWKSMIEQLNDPDKILWTYSHILPNFLSQAVEHVQSVAV